MVKCLDSKTIIPNLDKKIRKGAYVVQQTMVDNFVINRFIEVIQLELFKKIRKDINRLFRNNFDFIRFFHLRNDTFSTKIGSDQ